MYDWLPKILDTKYIKKGKSFKFYLVFGFVVILFQLLTKNLLIVI